MRRYRRRRRQRGRLPVARCAAGLLLTLTLLLAGPAPPGTNARLGGSGGSTGQVRALSVTEALAISTGGVDLGPLTAGARVAVPAALRVVNTSPRTLPLTVSVTGAPGLQAGISPQQLLPGEAALVRITGDVTEGEIHGHLRIGAFGQFITVEVPVRGRVRPAAPPDIDPAAQPTDGRTQ